MEVTVRSNVPIQMIEYSLVTQAQKEGKESWSTLASGRYVPAYWPQTWSETGVVVKSESLGNGDHVACP